tara:strand:- start:831 stop:1145 length:315 start_codon:yes stop_codon:yes gene_type:complete
MPGFVSLIGLVIAVLLALVVALIVTWPIHFLTKLPKLKSFLIGLAIGTLLASVCLWQSFGHHEKSNEITTAQKELPELFEHMPNLLPVLISLMVSLKVYSTSLK